MPPGHGGLPFLVTYIGGVIDPPTAEQCTARELIEIEGRRGVALWWPQMGGYVGKAVIFADPDGGADVLVWHDGEFPFEGTCPNCGEDRQPARIYVTDPGDWVRFGRDAELALEKLQ
jgi:hypothetical protein